MYDELIKRLRECTAEMNGEKTLWHQAADAIEELQKQLREEKVDNVNLTGWLAEEHAKVEELQEQLDNTEIKSIELKEEFERMPRYITDADTMRVLSEYYHHRTDFQMNALAEAISRVPTADVIESPRWIPVAERLPDGVADVLVTDGDAFAAGYYRPDAMAWDSCEFGWIENRPDPFPPGLGTVTHWMPLPEPPKDGET